MSCFLLWVFVCGFLPGILAEPADDETTPEPVESSSFTCQGRPPGYYADLETGCRSYHVCDGPNHFTYTCPERTLFQQRSRICDHSYLVRCEDSVHYYEGDVYQDLDEDDFGEDEEEEEEVVVVEEDDGGVDYEYTSNKDELDNTEEEKEEVTPSPEAVTTTTSQDRAETTTESATTDAKPSTTTETNADQSKNGTFSGKTFLKFSLKDPRWMFYIPEVENNSIETRRTGVRELVLPLERADTRVKFKLEAEVRSVNGFRSLCPRFCNPRFLVPGTCHPCIMIK